MSLDDTMNWIRDLPFGYIDVDINCDLSMYIKVRVGTLNILVMFICCYIYLKTSQGIEFYKGRRVGLYYASFQPW